MGVEGPPLATPPPPTGLGGWLEQYSPTLVARRILTRVLRAGSIPKHVAFIMDGNRRFARREGVETARGHALGFDKLKETLEWCMDLGVEMVTVYAFSLENFKRSQKEVDSLMALAAKKFRSLLEKGDLIQQHGICVRVLGRLDLLPLDLQQSIAEAVYLSRKNTRAVLNVCFAYTSRDEMTQGVQSIAAAVADGRLEEGDVSEELVRRSLFTEDVREPDLLVRTSGEVRLSDFLLWQTAYTCLEFSPVLWPEFSSWDLFKCFFSFQQHHHHLEAARQQHSQLLVRRQREADLQAVMRQELDPTRDQVEMALRVVVAERAARVERFLKRMRKARHDYFAALYHGCQAKGVSAAPPSGTHAI